MGHWTALRRQSPEKYVHVDSRAGSATMNAVEAAARIRRTGAESGVVVAIWKDDALEHSTYFTRVRNQPKRKRHEATATNKVLRAPDKPSPRAKSLPNPAPEPTQRELSRREAVAKRGEVEAMLTRNRKKKRQKRDTQDTAQCWVEVEPISLQVTGAAKRTRDDGSTKKRTWQESELENKRRRGPPPEDTKRRAHGSKEPGNREGRPRRGEG